MIGRWNLRGLGLVVMVGVPLAMTVSCSGGMASGSTLSGTGGLVSGVAPTVLEVGQALSGSPMAPPELFVDQVIELPFDAPIDASSLGGLLRDRSGLVTFTGVGVGASGETVAYHPFADQVVARAAVEVRENSPGGSRLESYVVGRHRDRPQVLVLDPLVDGMEAERLGIAGQPGLRESTQYTFRIAGGTGLSVGGMPARAVGADPTMLPITPGTFVPGTTLSLVFRSGRFLAPFGAAPRLVSIAAASGRPGTASQPLLVGDDLVMTFDRGIDVATVDPLTNLRIRNLDAGGRIVPGLFVADPLRPRAIVFSPTNGWGRGLEEPGGLRGFDVEVSVGASQAPAGVIATPLMSRPQGQSGERLSLDPASAASVVLRTSSFPGSAGAIAVGEDFSIPMGGGRGPNPTPSALPLFGAVDWDAPSHPGVLRGVASSGDPLATFNGNPASLGNRMQVTVLAANQVAATAPTGLGAPFEPSGFTGSKGSRVMQILDAADLGQPQDALELVEWGPANPSGGQLPGPVLAGTYSGFQAWCGMSDPLGGLACGTPARGLTPLYTANYNVSNLQAVDPIMVSSVAQAPANSGGVLVSGAPRAYTTPATTALYYPFPRFDPPFDYTGSGLRPPALILDINVEGGGFMGNAIRYRAGLVGPVRRQIGGPLGQGAFTAQMGGCEILDNRFTFARLVGSGESQVYDTGISGADYEALQLIPDPRDQPTRTSSRWRLRGSNVLAGPNRLPPAPVPGGPPTASTPWVTWFDGGPETMADPLALDQLDGNRFVIFDVTLRNDSFTNTPQEYTSLILTVSEPL